MPKWPTVTKKEAPCVKFKCYRRLLALFRALSPKGSSGGGRILWGQPSPNRTGGPAKVRAPKLAGVTWGYPMAWGPTPVFGGLFGLNYIYEPQAWILRYVGRLRVALETPTFRVRFWVPRPSIFKKDAIFLVLRWRSVLFHLFVAHFAGMSRRLWRGSISACSISIRRVWPGFTCPRLPVPASSYQLLPISLLSNVWLL